MIHFDNVKGDMSRYLVVPQECRSATKLWITDHGNAVLKNCFKASLSGVLKRKESVLYVWCTAAAQQQGQSPFGTLKRIKGSRREEQCLCLCFSASR